MGDRQFSLGVGSKIGSIENDLVNAVEVEATVGFAQNDCSGEAASAKIQIEMAENTLQGECVPIFNISTEGKVPFDVYQECLWGKCSCVHSIGGYSAQLRPCRFAGYLFGDNAVVSDENERDYLWNGVLNGFDIGLCLMRSGHCGRL